MIDVDTVRRIALSLPEAEDGSTPSALRFYVRGKQFAWTYLERVEATRARRPRLDVLAVRCAAEEKESLLVLRTSYSPPITTEAPAILVRLGKIGERELRGLLTAAWRCQAPRGLVKLLKKEA